MFIFLSALDTFWPDYKVVDKTENVQHILEIRSRISVTLWFATSFVPNSVNCFLELNNPVINDQSHIFFSVEKYGGLQ